MLELTNEQCNELAKRAKENLQKLFSQKPNSELTQAICEAAVSATIVTIREYEKMKSDSEN